MISSPAIAPPEEKRPGWHKFVFGGVSLCIGFFGLVNLASVVASHGLEWHGVIAKLIEGYRATIFPIYDFILAPLRIYFHVTISQSLKDVITCLLLSMTAANWESMVRDKKPLLRSLLEITRDAQRLRRNKDGSPQPGAVAIARPNFITRAVPGLVYFLSGVFGTIAVALGAAQIWTFTFFPNVPPASIMRSLLPAWTFVWLRNWWLSAIVGAIIGRTMLPDATDSKSLSGTQLAYVVFFVALVVLFCLPVLYMIAVAIGTGLFVAVLIASVVAPFAAWRTVVTTLSFFLIVLGVNWLVEIRVL